MRENDIDAQDYMEYDDVPDSYFSDLEEDNESLIEQVTTIIAKNIDLFLNYNFILRAFLCYLCTLANGCDQLLLNPPGPEGSKGRRL